MVLYYIVFLLSVFSFLLSNEKGRCLSWLVFGLMFIMTFYRGATVGTDTANYLMYSSEHRGSEYIMNGIIWLIATGDLDSRGIIYVTSLVIYVFSGLCVYKYKLDIRYFVVFFFVCNFFAMGLNISRQVAAVAITAYSVSFIACKSFKKSLLFFVGVILAYGFHYSSMFSVLLYPLLRFVKIDGRKWGVIMLLLSPLLLFNIVPVDIIIKNCLPAEYNNFKGSIERNIEVSLIGYMYRLLLLVLQYRLFKSIRDTKMSIMFVLGALVSNASIGMNPDVNRIYLVYLFLFAIAYSYIGTNMAKVNQQVRLCLFIIIAFSAYICFSGIESNVDLNNYMFYK